MLKPNTLFATTILLLATLACNALTPTTQAEPTKYVIVEPTFPPTQSTLPLTEADVPRVTLEETLTAIAGGSAIVVDVRSPEAYAASHIEGAINIPLNVIEVNPSTLDLAKDQWIITYCT